MQKSSEERADPPGLSWAIQALILYYSTTLYSTTTTLLLSVGYDQRHSCVGLLMPSGSGSDASNKERLRELIRLGYGLVFYWTTGYI